LTDSNKYSSITFNELRKIKVINRVS